MNTSEDMSDWDESEIVRNLRLNLRGKITVTEDRALGAAVIALAVQEGRKRGEFGQQLDTK